MPQTFIIDCPYCRAKVAAAETGRAERVDFGEEGPFGERLVIGHCPSCRSLLAGHLQQTHFEGHDAEEDVWSDVVRIYPKPAKAFSSFRIPRSATNSLAQADKSLQAGAPDAACVMFGRALEAVCGDLLLTAEEKRAVRDGSTKKRIVLADGIKRLREKNIIDDRLFNWSQELRGFRNLGAHPINDEPIPREDAEDLQAFVYAIIEYIYDLTERYQEFTERQQTRKGKGTDHA